MSESPHPHPVAVAASYVRPTPAGEAAIEVTPGAAGRTLAHSVVTLSSSGAGPSIVVQATTATLGDETPDYDASRMPDMPPPDECVDLSARLNPDPAKRPGLSRHVDSRLDPATAGWTVGEPSDEPVMRAWIRFVDGRPARVATPLAPLRRRPASDAPLETEALCGEALTVFEDAGEGWMWVQLAFDGYVGWMPSEAVAFGAAACRQRQQGKCGRDALRD